MALAVRRGELSRSEVDDNVKEIVDGKMTNKQIEDFAKTTHKGLSQHVKESLDIIYFVVIKPGFLHLAQEILEVYKENGFELQKIRTTKLSKEFARKLYTVHKKEDFYNDLVNYMSSGLSMALQFGLGNHAMTEDTLKQLLNIKDKIRDEHSESDMRNVIHSSDSWENARKESEIYF